MNLLSKILPQFLAPRLQFRSSWLLKSGIALLIFLSILIAVKGFLLNREQRGLSAVDSGQRFELAIKNGEVTLGSPTPQELAKANPEIESNPQQASDIAKAEQQAVDQPSITQAEPENISANTSSSDVTPEEQAPKDNVSTQIDTDTDASASTKEIITKPVVIIIIKGLGLSASSTREAMELPKEITMGFSPYAPNVDKWVKKSKASGHEAILNIPMETKDYNTDNPGPYSLLIKSSAEDNLIRLNMLLSLTKDYNAIYSDGGEIFTNSADNIKPILEVLQKENKYFVYGGGYENYSLIQVADSINYPILVNDLVLDDDLSTHAINEKMEKMEKIAKEKGWVVVMAHPYPVTVRMLKVWIQKATEKGLVVSPISTLLGKKNR